MKTHPEQRASELHIGNTQPGEVWRSSWRTTRLGSQPVRSDDKPYTGGGLLPWFIERSEVERAIQAERRDAKPWSAERIATYQAMLDESSHA